MAMFASPAYWVRCASFSGINRGLSRMKRINADPERMITDLRFQISETEPEKAIEHGWNGLLRIGTDPEKATAKTQRTPRQTGVGR